MTNAFITGMCENNCFVYLDIRLYILHLNILGMIVLLLIS